MQSALGDGGQSLAEFTNNPRCQAQLATQWLSTLPESQLQLQGRLFYSLPPFSLLIAVKPVDFSVATEKTELGNAVQGFDHLIYTISGFQINLLGTANHKRFSMCVCTC